MKNLFLLVLLTISLSALSQKKSASENFLPNNHTHRIEKSEYFEVSKTPKYRYDYKYDKKGLLTSITQKHQINNAWLPIETRDFDYDAKTGTVVCIYKPSAMSEGALDFARMKEIKNMVKNVDTFKIVNGNVIYFSKYKKEKYDFYLYQHYYTYENNKLTNVKSTSAYFATIKNDSGNDVEKLFPQKKIDEITFEWENDKIINIVQEAYGFIRKWNLTWQDDIISNIKIYEQKDDTEKLAIQYNFKNVDGKISNVKDYIFSNEQPMLVQEYQYEYDENDNLISSVTKDDSGFFLYKNAYETSAGNASLFIEKRSIYDYLKPYIK